MIPHRYLDEFAEPPGWLDFAGFGPISKSVRLAIQQLAETTHAPDPGGVLSTLLSLRTASQEAGARLLATERDRVVVVPSTGQALFHIAAGLRGGNVVVPAAEFPANIYPWIRAQEAGLIDEVRLVELPDARLEPAALARHVDSRTVAVSFSLVDYATGFRADMEAMRTVAGDALLVVDAVQAVGAVPVSMGEADAMVTGGQKWLRAGLGGAFLAVSDRALERLLPTLTGWFAVADPFDIDRPHPHPPAEGAARFQLSALPVMGMAALEAAVRVWEITDAHSIEQAILSNVRLLEEVVLSKGAEVRAPWRDESERAGIFGFRLPGESSTDTAARLAAQDIVATDRAGWVRLGPHATTTGEAAALLHKAL